MFRSYCFVHLADEDRAVVYGAPGVVGYLYWLKKPAVVQQKEINLIRDMLNDFSHESLEIIDIATADRLRITSGAFMDQEGQVVSAQGKIIIVKLEALNACISIDMSRNKIEKIKNTTPLG